MSDQPKGPGIHRVMSASQWRDFVRADTMRCVETCKKRGLTNYDIAAWCGVGRERVSHWASGKSTPDAGTLEALRELASQCGHKRRTG